MRTLLALVLALWCGIAEAAIFNNALTTNALPNILYSTNTQRLTIGTPTAAGPALVTISGANGMTNGLYIGAGTMGNGNNLQLWQTNGDSFLSFGKAAGAYSFQLYDNFNGLPLLKLRGSGIADLVGNWRPLNVGPSAVVGTDANTNFTAITLPAGGLVGGTGTVNTLSKWTSTNALGDSGIIDTANGNYFFGPTNVSEISFFPLDNPSGAGADIHFYAGVPGVEGKGGDVLFTAADGTGIMSDGGSVHLTAGQASGGNEGNIVLEAPGTGSQVQLKATQGAVIIYAKYLYPNSITDLGTETNRWRRLLLDDYLTLSGTTNQYTDDGTQLLRNGVAVGVSVSQNGTNGAPAINFTNTSTVTWARSGSNWTATATTTGGAPSNGQSPVIELGLSGTNVTGTIDWSLTNQCYRLTLTANAFFSDTVLANVPATNVFRWIQLDLVQDGTGGRSVTFSNSVWGGVNGTFPLSTQANSWDSCVLLNSRQTNGNVMVLPSNNLHR